MDDEARLPASVAEIIAADYARIRRLAWHFGIDREDLDDMTQEVIAKAWANRNQFRGTSSAATWVTRIALNHFATQLKRLRRRPVHVELSEQIRSMKAAGPGAGARAERDEAYAIASECVRRLGKNQREAFVLRYIEDLSYGEVAEILEISEGAARARTFEARKNLREMLKELGL